MLNFVSVTGPCAIASESSCLDLEEPHGGLSLPFDSDGYIVTTGEGGYIQMVINGEQFEMGANSVLHCRAGTRPAEKRVSGASSDLRLLLGRIWAKIADGDTFEQAVDNAVIGVRG